MALDYREVSCDGLFKGMAWVEEADTWNGWMKPLFPFEEVEKVLDAMVDRPEASSCNEWQYDKDTDSFGWFDTVIDKWVWVKGVSIETPDGEQTLYPLGSGEFCWVYHDTTYKYKQEHGLV